MLKNAPPRKNGPLPAGHRATSRNASRHHPSVPRFRKQPPPREPRKLPAVLVNHPEGFVCAWCGSFRPWSLMAGFDKRLKFCQSCVDLMDALELGLATTTTNVGRRST